MYTSGNLSSTSLSWPFIAGPSLTWIRPSFCGYHPLLCSFPHDWHLRTSLCSFCQRLRSPSSLPIHFLHSSWHKVSHAWERMLQDLPPSPQGPHSQPCFLLRRFELNFLSISWSIASRSPQGSKRSSWPWGQRPTWCLVHFCSKH